MIGLTVILSLPGTMTIFIGVTENTPTMLLLGVTLFAVLATIRIRFKVTCDELYLTSTGLLFTKSLKWAEITKVVRMADCGYPKNRFYGPFVYEFRTVADSLKINFKLFPIECMTKILRRAKELTP